MFETIPKPRLDEILAGLRESDDFSLLPDGSYALVSAADAIEALSAQIADLKNGWEHDTQCWREVEAHLRHQASVAEASLASVTAERDAARDVLAAAREIFAQILTHETEATRAQTIEEAALWLEDRADEDEDASELTPEYSFDGYVLLHKTKRRREDAAAIRALSNEVSK